MESLKRFISDLFKDVYIESLYVGNILEEGALEMNALVESMLVKQNGARPMLPIQHMKSREYNIPKGNFLGHLFSFLRLLSLFLQDDTF